MVFNGKGPAICGAFTIVIDGMTNREILTISRNGLSYFLYETLCFILNLFSYLKNYHYANCKSYRSDCHFRSKY